MFSFGPLQKYMINPNHVRVSCCWNLLCLLNQQRPLWRVFPSTSHPQMSAHILVDRGMRVHCATYVFAAACCTHLFPLWDTVVSVRFNLFQFQFCIHCLVWTIFFKGIHTLWMHQAVSFPGILTSTDPPKQLRNASSSHSAVGPYETRNDMNLPMAGFSRARDINDPQCFWHKTQTWIALPVGFWQRFRQNYFSYKIIWNNMYMYMQMYMYTWNFLWCKKNVVS